MASARMYNANGLTVETVGKGVESFLQNKKKMKTQSMQTPEGYLIKGESQEGWLRILGLGLMQQVQIIKSGDLISVTASESRWVEKFLCYFVYLVLDTIFYFLFWPLLFVSNSLLICVIVGTVRQYRLPDQILEFVEMFIMGGGTNVNVSMGFNQNWAASSINANPGTVWNAAQEAPTNVCPQCKAPIGANSKFCDSCGAKLSTECPKCHASVPLGKKFCPECGEKIETEAAKAECPHCHAQMEPGQKFCGVCGKSVE